MSANPDLGSGFAMEPGGEFMRSLWRLNHAIERFSRDMEASSGVTAQQRMIIRCIGRYPGMTPGQLAAQFHRDAGTVSTALGRLERKGLVERRRGHRDRRRVALGLTAAGRAIDRKVGGTFEVAVETLLKTVGVEEVARGGGVLRTLTDLIERAGNSKPRAVTRRNDRDQPRGVMRPVSTRLRQPRLAARATR